MPGNCQLRRLVWLTSLGLLLAACSATPVTTTSSSPPADLVVTMSEWRFAPQDSVIASGRPTSVELRNTGSVLHRWAVVDGPVESEVDLGSVEILASLEVNAGGVDRLELPALAPGVYEVVCPIPGHISNGMVGTLTIEE